jgi:hypothetical protein
MRLRHLLGGANRAYAECVHKLLSQQQVSKSASQPVKAHPKTVRLKRD